MTPTLPDLPQEKPLAAIGRQITAEVQGMARLFRRSPEWIVIVFAWIAAAFIPAFWYMGETRWWSDFSSPLIFQPFVPLFCAALLWQDREKLREAWNQTSSRKKRGSGWVLWLGCLIVMVSHLIHVLTVSAVGLVIVAVGIVFLGYGAQVLVKSGRALLFGLLFIPPPEKIPATLTALTGGQVWKIITIGLQKVGKDCNMTPGADKVTFVLQGQVFPIPNTQATAAILTGFVLLFIAVWRREKIGQALILVAFGAFVAIALTILVPFVVLLLPVSPLTNALVAIHPLFFAAASLTTVLLVRTRLKSWGGALEESSRTLGKLSQAAQKATDRATSGVAAGVSGGRVGRASRSVNKGTEAAIDKFFAAIAKPFKRKRRDHW